MQLVAAVWFLPSWLWVFFLLAVGVFTLRTRWIRQLIAARMTQVGLAVRSFGPPVDAVEFNQMAEKAIVRAGRQTPHGLDVPNGVTARVGTQVYDNLESYMEEYAEQDLQMRLAELLQSSGMRSGQPRVRIVRDPSLAARAVRFEFDHTTRTVFRHSEKRQMAVATTPHVKHSRPPRTAASAEKDNNEVPTLKMCVLAVLVGGKQIYELTLREGRYLVGRAPRCDIRINHPSVSGFHAELYVSRAGVFIKDVESSYGTLVDRVAATSPLPLRDGTNVDLSDEVQLEVRRGGNAQRTERP